MPDTPPPLDGLDPRKNDASPTPLTIPPIEDSLFLTGPTASGKTSIGVQLARIIDAEIISLDSMAIYRKMDIGTAKPTFEERGGIPHHLIDVVDPWEEFSLADYLKRSKEVADQIRSRGKKVLFVGGTPLYLKGALRGIFEGPPADEKLRAELAEREFKEGPGTLHRELSSLDSVTASRLHPNDTRRIIRALEVYYKTGRPISAFQTQFDQTRPGVENRVFALQWPREALYDRINRRVDQMMADGFLEEVRNLLHLGKPLSKTALQGVGYRELIDVIENNADLSENVLKIKQFTRNFAKRQGTWFRSFNEAEFIPMGEPFDPVTIARQIADRIG